MSMRETVFSFEIKGAPDMRVTQFRGNEGISDLFRFDIDLVSNDPDIDFDCIFNRPARLAIRSPEQEHTFDGVVASFEQLEADAHMARYQAALAPRLWLLTLNQRSWIYQDQTVPQILESVLKDHGFTSDDYDIKRLTRSYVQREYVVQYQETDFNFVSRWLEHEGIFYYFLQGKVFFTDNSAVLDEIAGEADVIYRPAAGLDSTGTESIRSVARRQRMLPESVVVKDYNWRKPKLDLKAQYKAAENGRGHVMEYGNHHKDTDEGKRLAQVRGEEIRCREKVVEGNSDCWRLGAGLQFAISEHPAPKMNGRYALTDVSHFGSQMGGLEEAASEGAPNAGVEYSNRFTCIQADVPYRPLRKTAKPKLVGTMNGRIDGSGDGQYAEIDDQGRYKVILPFDLSGKGDGKASRYIRMAQPYAGPDYGMHFPLHKGVEVIWTCIDGDPDRPIICGAVPNPDTGSPVTAANHKTSVIRDYSGNEIMLDGVEGNQLIFVYGPHDLQVLIRNDRTERVERHRFLTVGAEKREKVVQNSNLHVVGDFVGLVEGVTNRTYAQNLVEDLQTNRAQTVAGEFWTDADRIVLKAASQILLQVGSNFISISNEGIAIEGKPVKINCGSSPGDSSPPDGAQCRAPEDPPD